MVDTETSKAARAPYIDWQRGVITHQGTTQELRPQTMAVLKLLHDNAAQIVSKEHLMKEVWPNVAVTDDSLVQCITEIRKALGDTDHTIIKTMPKRGYVYEMPHLAPSNYSTSVKSVRTKRSILGIALGLAVIIIGTYFVKPTETQFAEKPAVAVLPFKNLGTDAKWNQLANVMTEDVIADLAQSHALLVIAPAATAKYQSENSEVRQIGRDLNVGYVLEASVLPIGANLRVNTRLIDAVTGAQIWAERYERKTEDMFVVEGEIAEHISVTLAKYGGVIANSQRKIAQRKPPKDLQAFDYYILGLEQKHLLTPEARVKAQALFRQSIAIDPSFARAYIGLSYTHNMNISDGLGNIESEKSAHLETAKMAVSLDPDDGEAHYVLAAAYLFYGEFEKGRFELERAVELSPANADILALSAGWWSWLGDPKRAAHNAEHAIRLNPAIPSHYATNAMDAFFFNRQFEQSVGYGKKVSYPARYEWIFLSASLGQLNRIEEAKTYATKLMSQEPNWSLERWMHENGGTAREQEANLLFDGIRKAGLPVCLTIHELKNESSITQMKQCEAQRSAGAIAAQ